MSAFELHLVRVTQVMPAAMAALTRRSDWGRWVASYSIGSIALVWFASRLAAF